MPGLGSAEGDLRRFLVADFAYHDYVGILAQDGSERDGEGKTAFFVHLHLGGPFQRVFHRVFDGGDVHLLMQDFFEPGVKRGGFSGACRACNKKESLGAVEYILQESQAWLA